MSHPTTDPSVCASPDGAPPSPLTPAAGAQTERPVVLAVDWPTTAYVPGRCLLASVPGTATVSIGGRVVTVGLAWDGGGTEQPYVDRHDPATTCDEDDAIERAVARAWDAHCEDAS